MNNTRRKNIAAIIERIEIINSDLEYIADEERMAFDNLPESIQYSERGESMEEAADELEEIRDELEDLLERLQDVIDNH